jgi:DNA topoisomerase I
MEHKLRFVEAGESGYTRKRFGQTWQYFNERGMRIRSRAIIDRLNSLALPPAYSDAWYAKHKDAHIQATGLDDRGRKQYRYHDDFRAAQEAAKYSGCSDFGTALPAIRRQVEQDLARKDLSKERVVAAVIRLLDMGSVRVGNEAYAKANKSFGATTLRNRHAQVKGQRLLLDYVGKSGKPHRISIEDARLARLVRKCQELPGQALFQFEGADGTPQSVTSSDVNEYLRAHTGDYTAKHFRTWSASVIAFDYLNGVDGKPSLKTMLEMVSQRLGNTPAIARKSYVHPALIEAALGQRSFTKIKLRPTRYYTAAERGFLDFLAQEQAEVDEENPPATGPTDQV